MNFSISLSVFMEMRRGILMGVEVKVQVSLRVVTT